MDPLSIVASITGILAVSAKLTNILTDFVKKERNAPESMSSVIQEVSELTICLVQLQPFVRGTKPPSRSQSAAISVEQVIVVVTSCVINLSKIEELLDSFRIDQVFSTFDRIRWIRREPELTELVARIRASRSSLNLMLNIFNT